MNQEYMPAHAPIALFVYKRPGHTKRTLESLSRNAEFLQSHIYIYCDGAKTDAEINQVLETRKLVHDWPHKNKTIIERNRNYGLSNSIIDGVTQLCHQHGAVIVVEDDMEVSEYFLNYMNAALVKYKNDERVISIHGYSFPIADLPETFFIKGASCWGWATWSRGWRMFEADGRKLFDELERKQLMYRFNILGSYPYKRMLQEQISGKNDSWAIRWYASALVNDKLTLHPGRSLVHNIGLDGSGSHCDRYDGFSSTLSTTPVVLDDITVSENPYVLKSWRRYFKSIRREKVLNYLISFDGWRKWISKRCYFRWQ